MRTYTKFDPAKLTELIKFLKEHPEQYSIQEACKEVGLPYWQYIDRATREIKTRCTTYARSRSGRPRKKIGDPIKPFNSNDTLTIENNYSLVPTNQEKISLDRFPNHIYKCWIEPIINKVFSAKCRFFFRVETSGDTEYYVAGYEYLSHPGQYTCDQFLHIYTTESMQNALDKLKILILKRLSEEINEPELGIVTYRLQDKIVESGIKPVIPKPIIVERPIQEIKATTKLKEPIPNGEYKATVSGPNGKISYQGVDYWFLLEKDLFRQSGLRAVVIDQKVTIYV